MRKHFIFIVIFLFVTGCYHYHELNDLSIVSGISISMNDGEYVVSSLIIHSESQQNSDNSSDDSFVVYQGYGSSVGEALHSIALKCPHSLYYSHLDVLIIDENISNRYLDDVLDFFVRKSEFRDGFYVLIGKNFDFLNASNLDNSISSKNIISILKSNQEVLGYTHLVTFQDLMACYLQTYCELAIGSIELVDDTKDEDGFQHDNTLSSVLVNGIAIYRDGKHLGYLDHVNSLVYNVVTNTIHSFSFQTDVSQDVYEVKNVKTSFEFDLESLKINLYLQGNASLSEGGHCIKFCEDELNKAITSMIESSLIKVIQNYHTDIYGFQRLFYFQYPSLVREMNQQYFLNSLDIHVKSSIEINNSNILKGDFFMKRNKISALQFACLSCFFLLSSISFYSNYLIQMVGVDSYLSFFIAYIIGFFYFMIFMVIFSYQKEKNIFEKNYSLFGMLLGKVINYFICILVFIIGVVYFYDVSFFAVNFFLKGMPMLFFMIIFGLLLVYSINMGIDNIARVAFVFFVVILFLSLIGIVGLIPHFDISHLKPFLENGCILFSSGGFVLSLFSIIPIFFLLVIEGKCVISFRLKKYLFWFYSIVFFILFLEYILMIGTFGINLSSIYQYPFYMVLQNVRLLGFIDRIENFISIKCFLSVFIVLSCIVYYLCKIGYEKHYKVNSIFIVALMIFVSFFIKFLPIFFNRILIFSSCFLLFLIHFLIAISIMIKKIFILKK